MNYFRIKHFQKTLKRSLRRRKHNNLVDALCVSKITRKITGIVVLDLVNTENGVETKFSPIGFVFFLIWNSLYFYSAYKAHINDQTILRNIFSTRMQRYGDDCEKIVSLVYVLLAMWKIPFSIVSDGSIVRMIIDVDSTLENLGEKVDYDRDARSVSCISIGQFIMYSLRLCSIWLILKNLNVEIPAASVYQAIFFDSLALVVTAFYCYILSVLRRRYHYANKILTEIKTQMSWEYKIFVRERLGKNIQRAEIFQDKCIREKLKSCARIYGLLYKVVVALNDIFGIILVMTMFVALILVILYLYYFLEATATGMFHDVTKYIDFCIYVFWQIAYAIGILSLILYFCESVMREAKETSYILHEIMSKDLSSSLTADVMQLSLQLLHQRPVFTAYGLYELNYALFEQAARSVSTYLVILLQFLSDANL